MKIYIDDEFKCHLSDDGTRRSFEVPFFDGKCAEFIEGYRYVPEGETWTRADGQAFSGEMAAPWRDYTNLAAVQGAVERTQAEADEQISVLLDTIENLILEV